MQLPRTFLSLLAMIATAIASALPAKAGDDLTRPLPPAPAAPASQWQLEYTPYAWIPFFTGKSSLGAASADIGTNIFEIIDESTSLLAYISYQELRRGKLGLYADVFWTDTKVEESAVRSGNLIAGLDTTAVADAKVDLEWAIFDSGVAYEIARRGGHGGSLKDPQPGPGSSTAIDLIGGARYWYIRPEVDLDVTATVSIPALGLSRTGAGSVSGSRTVDWWDPYIGARMRHTLASGAELMLKTDFGGFGVGSDFTWQGVAGYSFQARLFGHEFTSLLGYRALYVDFEEGSGGRRFGLELLVHGPVVGATFRW